MHDSSEMNILEMIVKVHLDIKWLEKTETNKLDKRPYKEVLSEFKSQNENINPFNEATVLGFAYIALVLPKESVFKDLSNCEICTDKFTIVKNTYEEGSSKHTSIIRHIRNALAHGRVDIVDDSKFLFCDQNKNHEEFKTEIGFADFGKFISSYFFKMKDKYFKNRHRK